jgi:hypothetical protein
MNCDICAKPILEGESFITSALVDSRNPYSMHEACLEAETPEAHAARMAKKYPAPKQVPPIVVPAKS